MPLLLDKDYSALNDNCLSFEESELQRFFIFTQHQLPLSIYTVPSCDVLVVIPPNYNQDGNDMFWTFPRLFRTDAKPILATLDPGGGDNRFWKDREFCRWSRHWQTGPGVWRPGRDNIMSVYNRIKWAFLHPDAQ